MKIKSIWASTPQKGYVYMALAVNLLTLILIFLIRNFLPPVVPLFYGSAVGESQLVSSLYLTIAPLTSILVIAINILLSAIVSDVFLKKVLIIGSFFVSVLTTITVFKIVFLVGFF